MSVGPRAGSSIKFSIKPSIKSRHEAIAAFTKVRCSDGLKRSTGVFFKKLHALNRGASQPT